MEALQGLVYRVTTFGGGKLSQHYITVEEKIHNRLEACNWRTYGAMKLLPHPISTSTREIATIKTYLPRKGSRHAAAQYRMTLFILTETSAGYALLKAKDKKLLSRDDVAEQTATAEGVCSLLKLKKFEKFDSAATALEEVAALVDGKVTPMLSKLLDSIKDEKKASLAVADPKLGMVNVFSSVIFQGLTAARQCDQQITATLNHTYI